MFKKLLYSALVIAVVAGTAIFVYGPHPVQMDNRFSKEIINVQGFPAYWFSSDTVLINQGGILQKLDIHTHQLSPFLAGKIDHAMGLCFFKNTLKVIQNKMIDKQKPPQQSLTKFTWKDSDIQTEEQPSLGAYFLQNGIRTDSGVCTVYQEKEELKLNEMTKFPRTVSQNDQEWLRIYQGRDGMVGDLYLQNEKSLIDEADGSLALYMEGNRLYDARNFLILYRKDGSDRFLQMTPETRRIDRNGFNMGMVASAYDMSKSQYLFYQSDKDFNPGAWEPFDAWWFNPENASLQHVVLPKGPWNVGDGFIQQTRCFSCGCSCYRHYKLFVGNGRIFINITGMDKVIDLDKQGLYELDMAINTWVKISSASESLDNMQPGAAQISPDSCHIARLVSSGIEILNICPTSGKLTTVH